MYKSQEMLNLWRFLARFMLSDNNLGTLFNDKVLLVIL